ncbi:hypothetical protein TNCT_515641 [Trichonephila clavata]|uniref:Uncharacterized protein n=1 Tax=Trichonephila clavata TaxID=2740835 RepID=A0A8X6I642_TRICU|nr:hypothetical protein TNCT_515641 [Trichonephila clavata]
MQDQCVRLDYDDHSLMARDSQRLTIDCWEETSRMDEETGISPLWKGENYFSMKLFDSIHSPKHFIQQLQLRN